VSVARPRVAINGFGRIGRAVFRLLSQHADLDVVAINDITPNATLAYLTRFDTVFGRFPGEVVLEGDVMKAGLQRVRMLEQKDPAKLPWGELGIDVVVEATGRFRTREECGWHISAGASRVILTVPAKDDVDAMVVMGVNDSILRPEHRIVSAASCTTNCLAPVAKVLHESFGLVRGLITTVHAYTNDQRLADVPHKDLRRSRAANENIIPTTTGAARAVGKILPALKGKLDGIAMRVPVPDGSTVDLVAELDRDTTVEAINAAVKEAASKPPLAGVLAYTEEPIVSSDIIQDPHSATFDALCTRVQAGRYIKVIAWYDNEWGYSCRVVDLIGRLAAL
jgi:glyceraldehyde 3-phosphate dehydrogenase